MSISLQSPATVVNKIGDIIEDSDSRFIYSFKFYALDEDTESIEAGQSCKTFSTLQSTKCTCMSKNLQNWQFKMLRFIQQNIGKVFLFLMRVQIFLTITYLESDESYSPRFFLQKIIKIQNGAKNFHIEFRIQYVVATYRTN